MNMCPNVDINALDTSADFTINLLKRVSQSPHFTKNHSGGVLGHEKTAAGAIPAAGTKGDLKGI
jgi:hypothetical protein